ncbi:hypothetical protein F4777DRAFT_583474 [Nemania sp. FL0916]|nr:hypothetical protein F4777DRAFT_583474 [Nemania sp. FL0916]
MDTENSRRSACDRCRGQKLRCVRPSGNAQSNEELTLEPCERCIKAGAECVSTLPALRKATREGRSSNVRASSRAQSDHTSLQPLFPNTTSYSQSMSGSSSIARDGRNPENGMQRPPSAESDYQVRAEIQGQGHPRSRKRRLTDGAHMTFGLQDFDDNHSLSLEPPESMSFSTGKGSTFLQNGSPNIDLTSFSLPPIPKSSAKPSDSASIMDVLFEPISSIGSSGIAATLNGNMRDINTSTENKVNTSREDQLHRLSELNSRILRDFKRINSIATADIVSSLTRCETENPTYTTEPPVPNSPIGLVLEGSQVFLELLQGMRSEASTYAESECSYSEFRDDSELPRLSSEEHLFSDLTARDPTAYLDHNVMGITSQQSSSPPPVDMPLTLIILTCYTLLLQTYETIFSKIQESLFAHDKLFGHIIPPILPRLHIGGFYLHKHGDLQMEILITISCKMLERIEEVLGINVISEPQDPALSPISQRRGLLDSSCASALLDVLFKQMGPCTSQGPRPDRFAMVKQTMESIRHVIKQKY